MLISRIILWQSMSSFYFENVYFSHAKPRVCHTSSLKHHTQQDSDQATLSLGILHPFPTTSIQTITASPNHLHTYTPWSCPNHLLFLTWSELHHIKLSERKTSIPHISPPWYQRSTHLTTLVPTSHTSHHPGSICPLQTIQILSLFHFNTGFYLKPVWLNVLKWSEMRKKEA